MVFTLTVEQVHFVRRGGRRRAFHDRRFPSRLREGKCPRGDQLRPGASQWNRRLQGPRFRRIAGLGRERCGKGQSDHGCDEYHAPRECHLLRHFVLTSLLIEPLWSPSKSSSVVLREGHRDTRGVEYVASVTQWQPGREQREGTRFGGRFADRSLSKVNIACRSSRSGQRARRLRSVTRASGRSASNVAAGNCPRIAGAMPCHGLAAIDLCQCSPFAASPPSRASLSPDRCRPIVRRAQ